MTTKRVVGAANRSFVSIALTIGILELSGARCQAAGDSTSAGLDMALREQVKASIDVSLKSLRFQQRENGSWSDSLPATAMVLRALAESHRHYNAEDGPFMRRAQEYVAAALRAEENGAESLSLGSAATAMLALRHSTTPTHPELLRRAEEQLRTRIVGVDEERPTESTDCASLGLVVEALRSSDELTDSAVWRRLGKMAWGCEGDAASAGLIAADLGPDPPTEDEFAAAIRRALPAAEDRSLPYSRYYFLVNALASHGQPVFVDANGRARSWRTELAQSLIGRQQFEGSWPLDTIDPNESETIVATCFAVLALERLYEDPGTQ